ncbi:MAG: hypothetical protein IBJ10_05685 [Phycisphaerales bacterium]|nr:hypothetical protein [Phycisphaerales bacterium]
MSEAPRGDFYVGYLALPWGHSRFLRVFVPLALWAMAALGGVMVWSMRRPGPAVWRTGAVQAWHGTVRERPYPALELDDGSSVLLVEVGKRGAQERVAGLDGRSATVRGWSLERDGRRLIEVSPERDGVEPSAGGSRSESPTPRALGAFVGVGEIVDAKCFLGAMKPGDGLGHRSCAALCVEGGIPPMLLLWRAGEPSFLLVLGPDGQPIGARAARWVGERVEVRGEAFARGGLIEVRVPDGGVRRAP